MVGVAVGTMSLVIVLSVFNGLEDFIRTLYNSFDPDIKVMPVMGKSFEIDSVATNQIRRIEGINFVSEVIEDNAYIKYRDSEMVVKVKGVDGEFLMNDRLRKNIVEGSLTLEKEGLPQAILGRGVQYTLNMNDIDNVFPLQFFYPKRASRGSINPSQAVTQRNIMVGGIFEIEKQFDMNYIVAPIDFVNRLMDFKSRRTALEINLKKGTDVDYVKNEIAEILGDSFLVLDSDEQHATLIKAIKIEKLFVFITFSFIIAVAAINIFFSLTMLAIDKKKDIAILFSLGASKKLIQSIFLKEGAIISFSGAILGMTAGILICAIQQQFGVVSMGIETAVIDAYPVKMKWLDFIYSSASIIMITLLFSSRPAIIASRLIKVDQL